MHITFIKDYTVTKVTGKGEKGCEMEVISKGRHEFEEIDNPFTFISTEPRHRDPRYRNRWLVLKGTTSGLAVAVWRHRATEDKDEKGKPKFVIE
ncbi:MAG: hypothetical protein V1704_00110 [Candidatus Vogelbacteria bacterium]